MRNENKPPRFAVAHTLTVLARVAEAIAVPAAVLPLFVLAGVAR